MANYGTHADNYNNEQQPSTSSGYRHAVVHKGSRNEEGQNQLDANTLMQLEEVWGGKGQGKLSFGESPDMQIRCDIRPAPEKELEPGSLGWVEWMYVAEVPLGSNVVASTLFGKDNRRQVVLNTRLGEEIKELWSVRKVCNGLLLMRQV